MRRGDEPAHRRGRGHDQHDDGGGTCRAGAHGEQALEGQLTVIQGTHGNGIHAGERAAFRGREDAEPDAAKQQHGHHECGHGVPDDLRGFALFELDLFLIAVNADDKEPCDHQAEADDQAGDQTDHEQLGDGEAHGRAEHELKSMPKGQFVVMKTGTHPMISKLKLFFKWGIKFEEEYKLPDKTARAVSYKERDELIRDVEVKYPQKEKESTLEYEELTAKKKTTVKT